MMTSSKRQWFVVGLVALLLAGGLAVWLGGYGPEIGKFFAYEQPSGYVPVCVAYGDRTVSNVGCCAGLNAKTPPNDYAVAFCLPPECTVHADRTFDCLPDEESDMGPGDADGDGDVDIFDYNIVVTNFGRTQ